MSSTVTAAARYRARWAANHVRSLRDPAHYRRARLRLRLRRAVHGSDVSIISSNCIGGRISSVAGNPYRSPTVGLQFDPDSFLELVSDLPRYLDHEIVPDVEAAEELGHPVGRMGEVQIRFQHYDTFDDASATWRARAARVDLDRVTLVFTDRLGATDEHVARFAALPAARKLMLVARPRPGHDCVVAVPGCAGKAEIDDLYTRWDLLEPVLRGPRLDLFR